LVLVNGHRVSKAGSQANFVDISMIPSIAIGRMEVVADGASANYGSDAIGGVVNIIVRERFDGLRVSGRYGGGYGFSEHQLSGMGGFSWDSGNLMIAAERYHRDNLASIY